MTLAARMTGITSSRYYISTQQPSVLGMCGGPVLVGGDGKIN